MRVRARVRERKRLRIRSSFALARALTYAIIARQGKQKIEQKKIGGEVQICCAQKKIGAVWRQERKSKARI